MSTAFIAVAIALALLAIASTLDVEAIGDGTTHHYGANVTRPLVDETGGSRTLNIVLPDGGLIAQVSVDVHGNRSVRYLLSDHLGSSRVALDPASGVVARFDYGPHGETTAEEEQASEVMYRYTGHRHEAVLGTYQTYHRTYAPGVGRWLSVDPLPGGPSPYVYAGGDPVNYYDPTGGPPKKARVVSTNPKKKKGLIRSKVTTEIVDFTVVDESLPLSIFEEYRYPVPLDLFMGSSFSHANLTLLGVRDPGIDLPVFVRNERGIFVIGPGFASDDIPVIERQIRAFRSHAQWLYGVLGADPPPAIPFEQLQVVSRGADELTSRHLSYALSRLEWISGNAPLEMLPAPPRPRPDPPLPPRIGVVGQMTTPSGSAYQTLSGRDLVAATADAARTLLRQPRSPQNSSDPTPQMIFGGQQGLAESMVETIPEIEDP